MFRMLLVGYPYVTRMHSCGVLVMIAPSWLDSSVGKALHRHRRGRGFESHSSLNFFRLSFRNCLSYVLTARIFILFNLHNLENIYKRFKFTYFIIIIFFAGIFI